MHKLKKLIKDELHEYGEKKELNISDVEPICYLVKAYKELLKICEMEDEEEYEKLHRQMGYPDMQADGMINFSYMSGEEMPEHKMKSYNPMRVNPYRNIPERGMDRWGRREHDSQMNRMDGRYDDRMMHYQDRGRYNDNRERYIDLPEVYSQRNPEIRTKGYEPSYGMNYKRSEMEDYEISEQEIQKWLKEMKNEDGTRGAHWTKEQTTPFAKSHGIVLNEDVDETIWNLVMNIMYSDNCKTAKKYGVDKPDYYADLAKDWLEDEDGLQGREKVSAYYENIVKDSE